MLNTFAERAVECSRTPTKDSLLVSQKALKSLKKVIVCLIESVVFFIR